MTFDETDTDRGTRGASARILAARWLHLWIAHHARMAQYRIGHF